MRFFIPTRIIFGSGSLKRVDEVAREVCGSTKGFLITDSGVHEAGILAPVLRCFPDMPVFDGVEPNPRHETVNRAAEEVRSFKPDFILGIGGGSALDAAKAAAMLASNPGNIEDYEGKGKYKNLPLPFIAVPTTCGTGSEVTWVSVITHTERKFKMSIKGPEMFPAAALIDPDLLLTLPRRLIASTGLDALTHAVEAYTVKPATPFTDVFARRALELIFNSLEEACTDIQHNIQARKGVMLGSTMAGIAFGNSDVGAVHCIAESVGSLYDTPHGVANSVFLPFVMEYNMPEVEGRYADIARIAGIQEEDNGTAAKALIEKIRQISRKLEIPSFRDLGIPESAFSEIAQKSFINNSNPSNPRLLEEKDYLELLNIAYKSFS
ncbi:MAG: iron-containing alcohol dehydrogenase [Candidatus Aminicenantes bacterium]|nr:iron-containing alcohol dehydrogenase [Candidatus Aminicenantes bacterium]